MCTQAATLCIPATARRRLSRTASLAPAQSQKSALRRTPPPYTEPGTRVARRGCGDSCVPRPGLLIRAASTAAIVLTLGWFVWSIWVTATYGHVAPQDQARLFRYMFWRALLSAYLRLDRFCQLVYAYTVMGYAILSHFVLRPVANAFRPVA